MPADALVTLWAGASTGMVLTSQAGIFHLQHQESEYVELCIFDLIAYVAASQLAQVMDCCLMVFVVIGMISKHLALFWCLGLVNPLWPSDIMWRHRSGSTLPQVISCCLMAPSQYRNRCWLVINKVQWHSSKGNFTIYTLTSNHKNWL